MGCVFCGIASGKSAAYVVHEDEEVIAFLDSNPVSRGHTLIISRKHYDNILDIPEEMVMKIAARARELASLYRSRLGADGFNTMQSSGKEAGQSVMHYHMHLVPRYKDDGLSLWLHRNADKGIDIQEAFDRIRGR